MRKSLFPLVGVGVLGVLLAGVLAFVLFPPSGGGELPEDEREAVAPVKVEQRNPAKPLLRRPGGDETEPRPVHEGVQRGPNPIAAEGVERRAMPDARAAGKSSAPWSLVRRTLLNEEDAFSQEVLEEAAVIINDLRQARRDPDSVDFDALETRQMALVKRLRESEHAANPTIVGALDRLDTVYAEYHEQIDQ